jgi:serine/threonine protein kinase
MSAKIADFYAANDWNDWRGTMTYQPPEVHLHEPFYAPMADIWALGITLSILLTGVSPFESARAACEGRMRWRNEPPISPLARDLLEKILRTSSLQRLTIVQISDHAWLKGVELPAGWPN